jgi:hypothetical protein
VMPARPCLTREEMHVLADTPEVGIVVLGDDTDAEGPAGIERGKCFQKLGVGRRDATAGTPGQRGPRRGGLWGL